MNENIIFIAPSEMVACAVSETRSVARTFTCGINQESSVNAIVKNTIRGSISDMRQAREKTHQMFPKLLQTI